MCLGVPGKVIEINESKAIIEVGNVKREVFIHLVPDVKLEEYVLVHAGCAIHIIDEDEAVKTLEILKELAEDEIC
ncbi:MAG: HypC/HybG/HupF family hydrogenase formation chaperone [Clostridiaceae bacterium]